MCKSLRGRKLVGGENVFSKASKSEDRRFLTTRLHRCFQKSGLHCPMILNLAHRRHGSDICHEFVEEHDVIVFVFAIAKLDGGAGMTVHLTSQVIRD